MRDLFESLPMELKTDPPYERPLSGRLNTLSQSKVILACLVVVGEEGGIFAEKFGQALLRHSFEPLPSSFG